MHTHNTETWLADAEDRLAAFAEQRPLVWKLYWLWARGLLISLFAFGYLVLINLLIPFARQKLNAPSDWFPFSALPGVFIMIFFLGVLMGEAGRFNSTAAKNFASSTDVWNQDAGDVRRRHLTRLAREAESGKIDLSVPLDVDAFLLESWRRYRMSAWKMFIPAFTLFVISLAWEISALK